MPSNPPINERDLSAAWNDGAFLGVSTTVDGQPISIVHRGSWTHGFGPDFRDAMVAFDDRTLVTGSIELHLVTSGWRAHGHHLDPRYNDVVLHVVGVDDGAESRRADGKLVPVVELGQATLDALPHRDAVDWSLVGGEVCAERLTRSSPNLVREAVWRLGDARLADKVARIEAQLLALPPGEVLYREIWGGLGYSANREPMRALASSLPLAKLESMLGAADPRQQLPIARGLFFGAAGFLPIAPSDAHAAEWSPADATAAEDAWVRWGSGWSDTTLPPASWTRARVRPANHPARRLAAGASLIAASMSAGGLLHVLLEAVRMGTDTAATLRELTTTRTAHLLGADRAAGISLNAVVPFALALAEHTGDTALNEAAGRAWEALPAAEPNEITRRALRQIAGDARLPGLGARGQQGLIHLDQTLCSPRRCFECPVAALSLAADGPQPTADGS